MSKFDKMSKEEIESKVSSYKSPNDNGDGWSIWKTIRFIIAMMAIFSIIYFIISSLSS